MTGHTGRSPDPGNLSVVASRQVRSAELRALGNRRLLYHVMVSAGFTNYPDEWWHFDYGNQNWALMSGRKAAVYGRGVPALRWL